MRRSELEVALVLAAGRGRRMGGHKALMDVGGQPWWRIQRARLAAWSMHELWVVSENVSAALRELTDAPEMIVADADAPMFASILTALRFLATDPPAAVCILPVDVPACSLESIELLRCAGDQPSVPMRGKPGHPVRLPWPFVQSAILEPARDPDWLDHARLDDILRGRSAIVPVPDAAITFNLNTPEAVAKWLARNVS